MPLLATFLLAFVQSGPVEFHVHVPAGAYGGFETVHAVVYLSQEQGEPRFGPDWFNPQPCYSAEFKHAAAGQDLTVRNGNAIGFPAQLKALAPGEYTVQAVVDRNLGGRAIGDSPGNYYSTPVQMRIDASTAGKVEITCDHLIKARETHDTESVKNVRFRSKLLSDFYGRDTYMKAAVGLPKGYESWSHRYPAIYEVPGFGGAADNPAEAASVAYGTVKDGQPFVYILLDPNCPTGHCVFADSANNGPWGTALTTELIPYLEKRFPIDPRPQCRLVTGHSSGGWSSLWLQVSHPDFFGGVWSTSPDPVDFTDFQIIDIYRPGENMFVDRDGHSRPLAREGSRILAYYKPFSDMERPIRGEQLGSFEAVFSPKGSDGQPEKLWNRDTGAIDPKVAEAWKKYDISWVLRTHWKELAPKLRGKLHVYCGSEDTFYLEGAVKKLKTTMEQLGSDAKIELVPGNHFTMMSPSLRSRIAHEMAQQVAPANRVGYR